MFYEVIAGLGANCRVKSKLQGLELISNCRLHIADLGTKVNKPEVRGQGTERRWQRIEKMAQDLPEIKK